MNVEDMEEDLSEDYYTSSEDGSVENSPRFPAQTGKPMGFGVPKLNLFGLSNEEPVQQRSPTVIPKLNLNAIASEESETVDNNNKPPKLNLSLLSREDTDRLSPKKSDDYERLSPKKKLTALNLTNIREPEETDKSKVKESPQKKPKIPPIVFPSKESKSPRSLLVPTTPPRSKIVKSTSDDYLTRASEEPRLPTVKPKRKEDGITSPKKPSLKTLSLQNIGTETKPIPRLAFSEVTPGLNLTLSNVTEKGSAPNVEEANHIWQDDEVIQEGGTVVDIITPAFSLPENLSQEQIKAAILERLGLISADEVDLFVSEDNSRVGCKLKNSRLTLNVIQNIYEQNKILQTRLEQTVDALITMEEKLHEQQSLLWKSRCEDALKKTAIQTHSFLTAESPNKFIKRSNSIVEGLPSLESLNIKNKCRVCDCDNFIPKEQFPWICGHCTHTSIKHDIDKKILSPRT